MARVPRTLEAGVSSFFCGPESFTPDLKPILGPAPELRNYWVAAGMNSIGILTGAGVGRLVAHWMIHGSADLDVTGVHIHRLHPYQAAPAYRAARTPESLGLVYKCHYPYKLNTTARGVKRSPLHARLRALGATFRAVSGWEMPEYFGRVVGSQARSSVDDAQDAWGGGFEGWGRPPFWEQWAREHRACRDEVVVFDMSFMSKFRVEGPGAGRLLDHVSTAAVDGAIGRVVYTQWLNDAGRLEADVTVTKLEEGVFVVVVTDSMHRHAEAWLREQQRRLEEAGGGPPYCAVVDVTEGHALLSVQGPKARSLMQHVTDADLSNDSFPFGTSRPVYLGMAQVQLSRITYVGELGYELLVPSSQALHVWDELFAARSEALPVAPAGLKALASLRLEKAYRDYGHDMDNTDAIGEVGLGFTCDFSKPGGFVGREAALREREGGAAALKQRLVQLLVLDPAVLLYHAEVVFRDGIAVGEVRAASYAHTLGGAVGLFMLERREGQGMRAADIAGSQWEVQVGGVRHACKVSLKPLYDPDARRVKA